MELLDLMVHNNEAIVNELDFRKVAAAGMIGLAAMTGPMSHAADYAHPVATQNVRAEGGIVAKVIAGEAAGEGYNGMTAVACVIQNRCGGSARMYYDPINIVKAPKQFSAIDNPTMMNKRYAEVKNEADEIAGKIGKLQDITGGATHYVTQELYNRKRLNPKSWISKMQVTKVIGRHVFMKEKAR